MTEQTTIESLQKQLNDWFAGRQQMSEELAALNKAVDDALAARKQWMDDHMADYALYKIGETLYDLRTGRRLGVVSKYYRRNARNHPICDTEMKIDYLLEVAPGRFDGTHGTELPGGIPMYGNADDLAARMRPLPSGTARINPF